MHTKEYPTIFIYLLCIPLFNHAMHEPIKPILKKIYFACKAGPCKTIEKIYKEHGLTFFEKQFLYDHKYNTPLIVAVEHKQWDIALKLIKLGVNIHHIKDDLLHCVAETEDTSEKKMLVLDALLTKNCDINALRSSRYDLSVLYAYINANHSSLQPHDKILTWFMRNGVNIVEQDNARDAYRNNIFYTIITACRYKTRNTIRTTRITCSLILEPIQKKLLTFLWCIKYVCTTNTYPMPPKPIRKLLIQVIQDTKEGKAITDALDQTINGQNRPIDYFITYNRGTQNSELFDAQRWKTAPLELYQLCLKHDDN